jgi:hypothetical protein
MIESQTVRSESRCEQCGGLQSVTYDIVANGLSQPIAITDRGGSYTITWTLGSDTPASCSPCTCRQDAGSIQGSMKLWGEERPMRSAEALTALEWLEQKRLAKEQAR